MDFLVQRPSQGFWGGMRKGHLFKGKKGQILRGARQYWGIGKISFQFFGEQANLFQVNKGTGNPPPPPPPL